MGVLDEILEGTGWTTDGFGDFDSNLIHEACDTMIEMDCPACPECGALNPIREAGMI